VSPAEFCDLTDPCPEGREWALANCQDMGEAWATARPDWLVWIATRPGVLDDRTLRRFAVWSARQAQHLMTDPRSLAALDVAERHAEGHATDEELAAAWDAARDAARDAAGAAQAARATARATARAAALAATLAARAAARAAAWAAAWAAALDAQAAWLRANATPDWERARKMGGAR
jgi:hypothetical protein